MSLCRRGKNTFGDNTLLPEDYFEPPYTNAGRTRSSNRGMSKRNCRGYGYGILQLTFTFQRGSATPGLKYSEGHWDDDTLQLSYHRHGPDMVGLFFTDDSDLHKPDARDYAEDMYVEGDIPTSPTLEQFQQYYKEVEQTYRKKAKYNLVILNVDDDPAEPDMAAVHAAVDATGFDTWIEDQGKTLVKTSNGTGQRYLDIIWKILLYGHKDDLSTLSLPPW